MIENNYILYNKKTNLINIYYIKKLFLKYVRKSQNKYPNFLSNENF